MDGAGLRFLLSAAGLLLAVGCEGGLKNVKLPGIPNAEELHAEQRKAEEYRRQYRDTKSQKAIRWLLANRVKQGMSLREVDQKLGEDGELVENDAGLKKQNIGFRLTDESRSWGPDENGYRYILIFRNARLINFEPKQYR